MTTYFQYIQYALFVVGLLIGILGTIGFLYKPTWEQPNDICKFYLYVIISVCGYTLSIISAMTTGIL